MGFAKKESPAPAVVAPPAVIDTLVGAIDPVGFFDPLGFAEKADDNTLRRYREAELTHGRVAMLAAVGFLAGEAVEGSSFLWDASVTGPAISLNLRPTDPEELKVLQTKELQNGRLAMIAAAGFMAQELADGKGIIEHFTA